jgi:DNA invertase Pin-like site-specific DNA recombinase
MALIGYARVSTTDQDLEVQIQALENKGCLKIFQDKRSGTTDNRPGFLACFEYLREGDVLYMTHLDRFARNKLITESRFEELRNRGIDVQALDHTIDIHTPEGNLMVGIGSSVAQYQRDRISKCTLNGLAIARANNRIGGRKPALSDMQIQQMAILYSQRTYPVHKLRETFKVSMPVIWRGLRRAREMGWMPETPNHVNYDPSHL